ncbi:hypothetical protein [Saccharothrix syringae]|uniref:Uncharacterized protein n=1 Tax=Saccharothrix syringae TaxID=103733 RepID=A0A5Q0HAP5_SACSY|nr:hypothetical protein [Saccharothrix syringae]QFZ23024.1 hypothetical protein EKG83_41320 [Saccharothrix syringae]
MATDLAGAVGARHDKHRWCTGDRSGGAHRHVAPAATGAQAALEADLLLAVGRTMAGLRRRARPLRPTSVVRRVRVTGGLVALDVAPEAVDDLLAEVLPCAVGAERTGIPGVRPVPGRDHLDLRVTATGAAVRLLGVSRARWHAAADVLADLGTPLWRGRGGPMAGAHTGTGGRHTSTTTPLTPPTDPHTAVASGVLRRLPLWRGAAWLSPLVRDGALELHWRDGPRAEAIAAILTDSCCRIPGATAVAYLVPDSAVRCLRLFPGGTTAPRPEPEWAWYEWLATTAPGPALDVPARVSATARETVPPHVWERQDMREALARREIGEVYRLLGRHGVGPERVAALTGQSPAEVVAVLGGLPVVDYASLCAVADGLGVPRGYLGLAHEEDARAVARGRCGCDEVEMRRRFLEHAALVTVGLPASGPDLLSWPGYHDPGCQYALPA